MPTLATSPSGAGPQTAPITCPPAAQLLVVLVVALATFLTAQAVPRLLAARLVAVSERASRDGELPRAVRAVELAYRLAPDARRPRAQLALAYFQSGQTIEPREGKRAPAATPERIRRLAAREH